MHRLESIPLDSGGKWDHVHVSSEGQSDPGQEESEFICLCPSLLSRWESSIIPALSRVTQHYPTFSSIIQHLLCCSLEASRSHKWPSVGMDSGMWVLLSYITCLNSPSVVNSSCLGQRMKSFYTTIKLKSGSQRWNREPDYFLLLSRAFPFSKVLNTSKNQSLLLQDDFSLLK